MDVSTQLHLITSTDAAKAKSGTEPVPRPLRGRVTSRRTPPRRRAVHWEAQWRLDAETREVGIAGVASAREALARAHDEPDGAGKGQR